VTDPATTAPEPARFEGQYTIDSNYPSRLANAFFRHVSFKPARWLPSVVLTGALFAVGVWLGSYYWVIGFAGVIGFAMSIPIAIGRTRSRLEQIAPAGGQYAIAMRDESLTVHAPLGTSQVAYRAYESLGTGGGFVFLRQRASRIYTILPTELFTPESLEFLRAKIDRPAA
jgi:hypothetical protein